MQTQLKPKAHKSFFLARLKTTPPRDCLVCQISVSLLSQSKAGHRTRPEVECCLSQGHFRLISPGWRGRRRSISLIECLNRLILL